MRDWRNPLNRKAIVYIWGLTIEIERGNGPKRHCYNLSALTGASENRLAQVVYGKTWLSYIGDQVTCYRFDP